MFFQPQYDLALFILRLIVGLVFMLHGFPKLKHPSWGEKMGLSKVVGFLVGVGEFFGGFGIFLGFLTQISAIGVLIPMAGAVYFHLKWNDPFVSRKGQGYEYALILAAISLLFLLVGGGKFSVDYWLII